MEEARGQRGRKSHAYVRVHPRGTYGLSSDPTAEHALYFADTDRAATASEFPTLKEAFERAVAGKIEQQLIPTAKAERELLPLMLFRGHKTLGEMQGLWNFSRALMTADVRSIAEAEQVSRESEDVRHLCGLHAPTGIGSGGGRLRSLIRRILSISERERKQLDGDVVDYLGGLALRSDTGGWFRLDPIDRFSPWSNLAWRRPTRTNLDPLAEVWPFMLTAPAATESGATLVTLVDAIVPKTLPELVRQEVCQDLLLAVLEGEVTPDQLRGSIGQYIAEVFRRYPIKYGPLSLDAPAPWGGDDDRSLLATLTAENATVLA